MHSQVIFCVQYFGYSSITFSWKEKYKHELKVTNFHFVFKDLIAKDKYKKEDKKNIFEYYIINI